MLTTNSCKSLPRRPCVVALGNFDGVHKGHTALIKKAVSLAKENGFLSCVYTFSENPHGEKSSTGLITDNSEKQEIMQSLGVDILFFDNFSSVRGKSCEEFCREILVGSLCCEIAVCGKNYRFGANRSGDSNTLICEMEKLEKKAFITEHVLTDSGKTVSSSLIRELLLDGQAEKAAQLLGRPFCMKNQVVHGRHLGTELGIPTVNQLFPEGKLKIANGVYACVCEIDGKKYAGVANVGTKPTVTSGESFPPVLCETHIIAYHGNLYGRNIMIEFYKRLRGEKKFDSLDGLVSAVKQNIAETKEYFSGREDILI